MSLKNCKYSFSCNNNPLFAGIGSIIMQAISSLNCEKACSTASLLFKGTTIVSLTKLSGTPAEEVSPNVTNPEPAFTNNESEWPW